MISVPRQPERVANVKFCYERSGLFVKLTRCPTALPTPWTTAFHAETQTMGELIENIGIFNIWPDVIYTFDLLLGTKSDSPLKRIDMPGLK